MGCTSSAPAVVTPDASATGTLTLMYWVLFLYQDWEKLWITSAQLESLIIKFISERQKSIQFADSCDQTINSNEEIENSERHDTNNVLPQCDTLEQTIRLVKSDISLMETFPLKEDKS